MSEAEHPFEHVYQDAKRLKKIQKRFSFTLDDSSEATVPVFVRLKPQDGKTGNDFLSIDTQSRTITIKKKTVEKSYKFTHIFGPETSQEEIFEQAGRPYLKAFLEGARDSIFLFTYGASSSGKTYTIQGDKGAAGIQPRLIAALFKCLERPGVCLPGVPGQSAKKCSERDQEKNVILTLSQTLLNMPLTKSHFLTYSELEDLYADSGKYEVLKTEGKVGVWFSYYEIYNEQVYDLLDEPKENRSHLRILNDKSSTYVEGLKSIEVNCLREAYLVYCYGRYNLTVSSTGINSRSSRSHSIFTVRLASEDGTLHSSFSVCDLAGTERADRTGNVGLRLREAQRINTSFLTLNRCLRTIRENQSSGKTRPVPYRESKLTKILGPAMTCPGTSLVMLVTVTQDGSLAEETESSLKESSVAADIKVTAAVRVVQPRRHFADLINTDPVNWNEVAKKKVSKTPEAGQRSGEFHYLRNETQILSPASSQESLAFVYKQLNEEILKRKYAEEKLLEMDRTYKEKIDSLESEVRRNNAERTINILQKELEEQVEDSMATRTEILRLMKVIRIMKEERVSLEDNIKNLESINKGLNKMLDDAKEDIETLQTESQELESALQQKEQIIILKDDKLHSFEVEMFELEQNLEKNSNEIDAYDKQLTAVEGELKKKKLEIKDLIEQNEKLSEKFITKEHELKKLKEISKAERDLLKKQLEIGNQDQTKRKSCKAINIPDDSVCNGSAREHQSTSKKSLSTTKKNRHIPDPSRGLSGFTSLDINIFPAQLLRNKSAVNKKNLFTAIYGLSTPSAEDKENVKSMDQTRKNRKQLFQIFDENALLETPKREDTESSPRAIWKTLRTGKKY